MKPGTQPPRIRSVPDGDATVGEDALDQLIEWGWRPDPWQEDTFIDLTLTRPDGKWAAFETGTVVPRQNGKGDIAMALEMCGMFLWGETILHSAHQFKTTREHFLRVRNFIAGSPELSRLCPTGDVRHTTTGSNNLGFLTTLGTRLMFVARSRGSGRGFTVDRVVWDEAYDLPQDEVDAQMPIMSARSMLGNPQMNQFSSAGMTDSHVLAGVRARGMKEGQSRFAYHEWSIPDHADHMDEKWWWASNPAMGLRISPEFVRLELQKALGSGEDAEGLTGWKRERLGVWERLGGQPIVDMARWRELSDPDATFGRQVAIGIDVSPDSSTAALTLASWAARDVVHVEVLKHEAGTAWLLDDVPAFRAAHARRATVYYDQDSPAAGVAARIKATHPRLQFRGVSTREMGGSIVDLLSRVDTGRMVHRPDESLDRAVEGARLKDLGEGLSRLARRKSLDDITPLAGVTAANAGLASMRYRA